MKNSQLKTVFRLLFWLSLCFTGRLCAQDTSRARSLTLREVFDLALLNSSALRIAGESTDLARQQVEIAKNKRLPSLSGDLTYGYLSNAQIWTPSLSNHTTGKIPHHLTVFNVSANQLLFAGKAVSNEIKKATLEEQVARLSQDKNTQDIKLLVAARYLDIARLNNLNKVYEGNRLLAENRLKNILAMARQGMVTRNDILRTELAISDLSLTIRRTDNDIRILNEELNTVIGLPETARLLPDSSFLATFVRNQPLEAFREQAYQVNPGLKIALTESGIAETNLKLLNSERSPVIAAFAASNLQRPYLNALPAIDVYYNVWQAGIGIKYNISSIYQSPKKIAAGRIALQRSKEKETLQKQNVDVSVSSGYIRFTEAQDDLRTYLSDLRSAQENYRIVEKKYFNQLALLTDMIDAANIKLEAETKVTNAGVNIVFTYCQLLNSIGNL
jgi:outer membrane protein